MIQPLRRAIPLLLIAVLLAGGMARSTEATTSSTYCAGSVEQQFLTLINNYRAQKGAGKLAMSQTLGAAAQHKALDMAATGTLTHTLSDGTDWLTNIINHGYPYGYRTENIAWGYASAQNVFDAWKASSAHNSNMLNTGFGAIGIQRVYDAKAPYGYYWATTFGSQLDTAATLCSGSTGPTSTATAVPLTPTATRTPTTVPLTATATAIPPTPTATIVPPTATSVPPTPTAILQPPKAPTALNATSKSRMIQLSWRDNASNETGYRVYRSADGGVSWQAVADALSAGTTKYQDRDSGLQKGQTYAYFVVAFNATGESAKSNIDSVRSR